MIPPLHALAELDRLLEVSEEAYRDPPDSNNPNEINVALADFGRLGLTVVARVSNAEKDTHCFVLKDELREVRYDLAVVVVAAVVCLVFSWSSLLWLSVLFCSFFVVVVVVLVLVVVVVSI